MMQQSGASIRCASVVLALAAAGCGLKGPLELPEKSDQRRDPRTAGQAAARQAPRRRLRTDDGARATPDRQPTTRPPAPAKPAKDERQPPPPLPGGNPGPRAVVEPNTLVLVDGSSYLYRAFHALPPLTQFARRADRRRARRAQHAACACCASRTRSWSPSCSMRPGKTFRDDLFAEYKAHRRADAGRPARAGRAADRRRRGARACRCCASPASRPTT